MEKLNKYEKSFIITLLQREIRKNQKYLEQNPDTFESNFAQEAIQYAKTIVDKIENSI